MACLVSCTDLAPTAPATVGTTQKVSAKPTLVVLSHGEKINIRWKDNTPSIDIDGEGWTAGVKQPDGINFAQSKFYGLTLNFEKKTYVQTGFDGSWLPVKKGTFKVLK